MFCKRLNGKCEIVLYGKSRPGRMRNEEMEQKTEYFIILALIVLILGAGSLLAEDARSSKGWVLTGELSAKPKRFTNEYPLSDQQNTGKWSRYEPMSDEFEGRKLDADKWWPNNPSWLGRQPGYFYDKNITVSDGKLHLTMKKEEPAEMPKNKGYHTYTSAAVKSKGLVLYGYFEIRCKPMNSAGSSSFWFYSNTKNLWTEIDVFEIGGKAAGFEKKYNMNVHVFKTPQEKRHWSKHGVWVSPANLADDYHVYALEWDKEKIKWYFDGVLIRWVENTHWHQPLALNFDSETMPNWFGLPMDEDLPSTYSIEYMRAWKNREEVLNSGKIMICMLGAKGVAGMTEQQEKDYKRIFAFMDRDRDGKVSKDQYVNNGRYLTPRARSGIFAATDRNKDDVMTEAEYVQNRAITDEAKRIVGVYDIDKNGKVSVDEFIKNSPLSDKTLAEEIFKKLDIDKSQDLIVPEYLRIWGNWAREK